MKRFLFVCAAAITMVAGAQTKAEAAIATQLHICQGATCVDFFGGQVAFGVTVIVGDYAIVLATGAVTENADFSQSQTTTLNLRRISGTVDATPLEVWLQSTGFSLPTGPAYIVNTTLGATSSPTSPGAVIDYMAWLSTTNATGFPPAGSSATGEISCFPTGGDPGSCSVNGTPILVAPGATPYSLTTRTTFNIAVGDNLIYGSTGQTVVTAVPEPMSLMLIGTGLLGLGARARRRLKK